MNLHTLSRAPGDRACSDCLALLAATDALLLLGDGVYAALAGTESAGALAGSGAEIWVLAADAALAGVTDRLMPGARLVDDAGFVALTERCSRQLAWY